MIIRRYKSFLYTIILISLITYLTITANRSYNLNSINELKEFNFNKIINNNIPIINLEIENSIDLKYIIKLFTSSDLFLLDIDTLKTIEFEENVDLANLTQNSYLVKKFNNLIYPNNKLFSFGILNDSLSNFESKIVNLDCLLFRENNIYIKCGVYEFQIVILYSRGDFYWINSDNYETKSNKYFGDTPRALNIFRLVLLLDSDSNVFKVTNNIKKLLFDYDHSEFIECNRTLASREFIIDGIKYEQNLEKNALVKDKLKYLADSLESFYKHYWLAGGTLLGWYRDCGLIPHTTDTDFGAWAHEYDIQIKKHFLGNKIVSIVLILGLENDMYEFRLYGQFTYDLFFVYKENSSYQSCGYQIGRNKYKRLLPEFNKVCSGEMFGHKYMIPCDPVSYLNFEYGGINGWITPFSRNYSWKNMLFSGKWSDSEWPYAFKFYYTDGSLNVKDTLNTINKYATINLTKLPFDE